MKIFLVAGERSGDLLGAKLIAALHRRDAAIEVAGVGGPAMAEQGVRSLFPLDDIAVMGFTGVLARLPHLLARIEQTARAAIAFEPDVLVIIDSPDFTHRVAMRVRKRAPTIPIVDYVSPSVWAWRPGRAKKMRAYIDEVLALLPFEPDVHRQLGGPPCTFVGHPLVEDLDALRPSPEEQRMRESEPHTILVMPGSRLSEIERLMPVFGEAVARVGERGGEVEFVLPAVAHFEAEIRALLQTWCVEPRVITGNAPKHAAMRQARAALVASGTATLELALTAVPFVVAYKVSLLESLARPFIHTPSIVLPNLVIARNLAPEFLQEQCTAENLAAALHAAIEDRSVRNGQRENFASLPDLLAPQGGLTPSDAAAQAVLACVQSRGEATSLARQPPGPR